MKTLLVTFSLLILLSLPTEAATCLATRSVTPVTGADQTATAVSQDIELEKTYVQEDETQHSQFSVKGDDAKNVYISATIDEDEEDATLLIRDPQTGLATSSSGAFGKDGLLTVNLAKATATEQTLITLSCQK